jgi:pyruvate dehydrogenase E2 component (dihydrolipoamide acetyltransferase)
VAHALIMPRQGNTVESCIITRWIAGEGDHVSAVDAVCEVETDKASFDVPAGVDGVVLKILHAEGEDVPVLVPIAVIGARGEDWKAALSPGQAKGEGGTAQSVQAAVQAAQAAVQAAHAAAQAAPAASRASASGREDEAGSGVSPRARARAAAEGVDPSAIPGTGPGGRVIERDVVAAASSRPAMTAAARTAVASGAAAPSGAGTAIGGRVGLGDLGSANALASGAPAVGAVSPRGAASRSFAAKAPPSGGDSYIETPMKGVRKIISERMLGSLASTAQLTFNGSALAARILDLRARFKASDESLGLSEVTIGDLVLFAVSRELLRFPNANATLEGGVLRSYSRVHLALAVDTPRGLMVPVIRNADLLSLRDISAESRRLAAACQSGSIDPGELSGGTFTVSNLGAFGIESFTPVLNAPQVGILGVDAITQRAAAGPGGSVVLEPRMGLSLTVDHQIVDGAPAARLLKAFADAIADIDLLLMA